MKAKDTVRLLRQALGCFIIGITDYDQVSPELKACYAAGLGGVILFDRYLNAASGKSQPKNIRTPGQLKQFIQQLKESNPSGFIAVDHEGGRDRCFDDSGRLRSRDGVTRLRPELGFTPTQSALTIGHRYQSAWLQAEQAQADPVLKAAQAIDPAVNMNADLVAEMGFNLVFGPVVDVHASPSPIIGDIGRAYAEEIHVVIACATAQMKAYQERGIVSALKHFPGHGRATVDSHTGITDASATWERLDLLPFQTLAPISDMMMLGHLIVRDIDPIFPASVSKKHVALCRRFFPGVLVSDDAQMDGIVLFLRQHYASKLRTLSPADADHFLLKKLVEQSFNAGVDLLVFGHQLVTVTPEEFLRKTQQVLLELLQEGRVLPETITTAYQRVAALKSRVMPQPVRPDPLVAVT